MHEAIGGGEDSACESMVDTFHHSYQVIFL